MAYFRGTAPGKHMKFKAILPIKNHANSVPLYIHTRAQCTSVNTRPARTHTHTQIALE